MRKCSGCGSSESEVALFCGVCGKQLIQDVSCLRCSKRILPAQGYVVYSETIQGTGPDHRSFISTGTGLADIPGREGQDSKNEISELGTILYCEECASALFTTKVWQEAKALEVEMDADDLQSTEGKEARFEVIGFSIALRAKRRGFSPEESRAEARELAKMWWQNQEKARQAAKEGLVKIAGSFQYVSCAHCGKGILPDKGYVMYSEAIEGTGPDHRPFIAAGTRLDDIRGRQGQNSKNEMRELGPILYCEECANALFTKEVWQEAKALEVEMDADDLQCPEGKDARSEVIGFSIALRAKRRGFDSQQARSESRELAKMWWQDQDRARQAAKEGLVRLGGSSGGILSFFVIVLGTALVLSGTGVSESVGAGIGLACWYAYRFFVIRERQKAGYGR